MNNANDDLMTSFSSFSTNEKQKTSTEAAVSLVEGAATKTDTHSNNDDDNDDDKRQGALKLPATKLKKTTSNSCLQDHAATQPPRIDTDGHLFTMVSKGSASVSNRKKIDDVDAWFEKTNPTFPVHLMWNASVRAQGHAPMKGIMWTEPQMEKAMMEFTVPSRLKCVWPSHYIGKC
jgi:hypothetical protein